MRRKASIALVLGLLSACAAERPTIRGFLEARRYGAALAAARSLNTRREAGDTEAAIQAALDALRPRVRLEAIDDQTLMQRVGRPLARRIRERYLVLRPVVEVAPGAETELELWFGTLSQRLPVRRLDPESLAELTQENFPKQHEHSQWKTDSSVQAPQSLIELPVFLFVTGPLALLSLHRDRWSEAPSEAEIQAAAPRALALAAALKQEGAVLVERPQDPGVAVEVHYNLSIRTPEDGVLGLASAHPIDFGPEFERQFPLEIPLSPTSTRSVYLERGPRCEHPSIGKDYFERKTDRLEGPCPVLEVAPPDLGARRLGLVLPPRPAALGTPAKSDAARPSFARWGYTPNVLLPKGPPADAEEVAVYLECAFRHLNNPSEESDDVFVELSLGQKTWARPGDSILSLPLLNIPKNGVVKLSFWDRDLLSAPDWLASVEVRRSGVEAVLGSLRPKNASLDMSCNFYGRETVERGIEQFWGIAMDAIEVLEDLPIVVDPKNGWGPMPARSSAEAAISNVAGLAGWDDPRVAGLLERLGAWERRRREARKMAAEALSAKPPRDTPPIEILALTPTHDKDGDGLRLEIRNHTEKALSAMDLYTRSTVILANGELCGLLPRDRGGPIPPGQDQALEFSLHNVPEDSRGQPARWLWLNSIEDSPPQLRVVP
ncbi:MAG: hypothetical protein U1E65_29245 [Myxococcota bacterium]